MVQKKKEKEERKRVSYHNLHASILWDIDDFVALDVSISWVPGDCQRGYGWVGHHHVVDTTQRNCKAQTSPSRKGRSMNGGWVR